MSNQFETLTQNESEKLLQGIPEWRCVVEDGIDKLKRDFAFANTQDQDKFVAELQRKAEEHDHHPVIETSPKKVTVLWWNHKAKGLTELDFVMAVLTNGVYVPYESKDIVQNASEDSFPNSDPPSFNP